MKRVLLTEIKGKDVTEHVMTEQVGNVIKGYITVNGKFERTFEQELNLSPENLALNFLFRLLARAEGHKGYAIPQNKSLFRGKVDTSDNLECPSILIK